jgi:hypothetical protein
VLEVRKKIGILWVLLIAAFIFMSGGCGGGSSDFAGGSGTSDE